MLNHYCSAMVLRLLERQARVSARVSPTAARMKLRTICNWQATIAFQLNENEAGNSI
jgi:hypothetical protein